VRLLFDANLSPQLVNRLAELFPDSIHVFGAGLGDLTSDETIWDYARIHHFVIVTADSDFLTLAEARGAPPWVVRLENCNYKTRVVENLLRQYAIRIAELEGSRRPVLVIRNTASSHRPRQIAPPRRLQMDLGGVKVRGGRYT
jgi:predicted nuclease of predicted toxin-antitoxin system